MTHCHRENDAENPADTGERHGFKQKLRNDIPLCRTDFFSQPYFSRTFSARDQHDIYNADSADQASYTGNGDGDQPNGGCNAIELLDKTVGGAQIKNTRIAW